MKYRVIALDIDGTLKGDCSRMSSYMLEILEECVTQGALVSVATGRTLNSALNFLEQAPIIEAVIERDLSVDQIAELGFDREIVGRILEMVKRNEYKRRQAPPGVRITQRAFGRDRRYPITARYF